MSQRKATGGTGATHKSKATSGVKTVARTAGKKGGSGVLPIVIIVVAVAVMLGFFAYQSSSKPADTSANAGTTTNDTTLAPPMTGVEEFDAGVVNAPKAKVATFKLVELSGTDCARQIVDELRKAGGAGRVRADYSNALLEVQSDPSKLTESKIIDALIKANHPGKLTTEKIPAK